MFYTNFGASLVAQMVKDLLMMQEKQKQPKIRGRSFKKQNYTGPIKAAVHGVGKSRTWLSDFTFTFHFHALEKEMATHSSVLAWKIPWTEEPGRLQSMGSGRVGHDWATSLSLFTFMRCRRKWQPTPVFLPGESQRWEPDGLPSMGSHRVGHYWSDLAAAAAAAKLCLIIMF